MSVKTHACLFDHNENPKCFGCLFKFQRSICSFAMVLYELITREVPFSGCGNPTLVPSLILARKKPNIKKVDRCGEQLELKDDMSVFELLKELMIKCWNDDAVSRPNSKEGVIWFSFNTGSIGKH